MVDIGHQLTASRRRWPLFFVGIVLFFLGPILYGVQFHFAQLWTPWYLPVLATVGVAFMIGAAWQRRGVLRTVTALLFFLMCGFEWYALAVATKTPPYTGPVRVGDRLPSFSATLANGEPFTERDLSNGAPTVLTFFRGRW